ncbi:hypothetical protein LshimejAT787_0303320 [Lyophyllum shimeji]|uniref:Uncharacterized protein n=1 Tax=Lyophyllum shimeji TaxID=47721 RepID=A0A9P3PIH8_LYOSH|nr:hypothetical protein LshimejAT787_0303320 [Lyophyllum shimeji]
MALQRSKSAPQGIPALLPMPRSVPRASSFQTIQNAVKTVKTVPLAERTDMEREDPFSLLGFFPSSLGEEKWGWIRGEEKVEKAWTAEEGESGSVLFGESDKLTQEAIKGEDKLGVLSLGGLFQDLEGKLWSPSSYGVAAEREAPDEDREAVDEDSLWLGLRVRRGKTLGTMPEMAGRDAEDWKTSIDSAIDEYFPIWDIDSGNSRETKLPQAGG